MSSYVFKKSEPMLWTEIRPLSVFTTSMGVVDNRERDELKAEVERLKKLNAEILAALKHVNAIALDEEYPPIYSYLDSIWMDIISKAEGKE